MLQLQYHKHETKADTFMCKVIPNLDQEEIDNVKEKKFTIVTTNPETGVSAYNKYANYRQTIGMYF